MTTNMLTPYPVGSFPQGDASTADLHKLAAKSAKGEKLTQAERRQVAQGFESLLLKQVVKQITSSMLSNGMFGQGAAAEQYQDMFNEQMAQVMTSAGGIGLSAEILAGLDRQEQAVTELPADRAALPLQGQHKTVWGAPRPEPAFRALEQAPAFRPAPQPQTSPKWRPITTAPRAQFEVMS